MILGLSCGNIKSSRGFELDNKKEFKIMTAEEVNSFVLSSALAACDSGIGEYGSIENAIDSYRDNIRDTLNDEGLELLESRAFKMFDDKVAEIRATT